MYQNIPSFFLFTVDARTKHPFLYSYVKKMELHQCKEINTSVLHSKQSLRLSVVKLKGKFC